MGRVHWDPQGAKEYAQKYGVEGFPTMVFFNNGDIKQTSPDGAVFYFYASAQTTHISQPDGTQLYQFPNGQLERHRTDGFKEIRFADGASKIISPSGDVEEVG